MVAEKKERAFAREHLLFLFLYLIDRLNLILYKLYICCYYHFGENQMNKILMGLLAVSALALVVGQAVADSHHHAKDVDDEGGVVVIETISEAEKVAPQEMKKHHKEHDSSEQPVVEDED